MRSIDWQKLLDRMRHAQPSRVLDGEVHRLIGGSPLLTMFCPHYTSDFEAAYSIMRKGDVTLLSLEGGWEPSCPEAHPAWSVRYYTRERPPEADNKNWYGAIAAGVQPAIALCRASLVVLARARGFTVRAE